VRRERPSQSQSRSAQPTPALLSPQRRIGRARQRLIVSLTVLAASVLAGGLALAYYATDANLLVGYRPVQPIDFSHKLHAGELGLDCRYCHSTVERSPFAAVPTSRVCMNCHGQVRTDSVKLLPLRATYAEKRPVEWVRVHNLPDFVYFDHSLHLVAGVGCSTCHGRVDQMERVEQVESLSMGWCLGCHRNPAPYLRKPSEITNMAFVPKASLAKAVPEQTRTASGRIVNPPLHCSGCHR